MPLFFADLVREFSSSAGAGDFVLEGAVPGHRRFAEAVPAGARFHYCIAGITHAQEWETGEGEIGSGGALVRHPVASSAGGGLVAFSAGLKTVALTVAASWFAGQEEAVAIGDVDGLAAALAGKAESAALGTMAGKSAADYAPLAGAAFGGAVSTSATLGVGTSDFADPIAGTAKFKMSDGSFTLSARDHAAGQGYVAVSNGTITGFIGHTNGEQGFVIGSLSGHPVTLRAANNAAMWIDTSGNVGVANIASGAPPNLGSRLWVDGVADASGGYRVGGAKVVGARATGWVSPTGTATRATFDTGSVTTAELAERVKALVDDLRAHGLIGS